MARAVHSGLLGLALVALLMPFVAAISKNDLYPYTGSNANILQPDANGILISSETTLKTPIAFYDNIYNKIFVNGNGVITFIRAMQRFFNIAFPLDDPVIAPLYTHVDTRASGKVFYGETNSQDVLDRASGIIRSSFKNALNFVPTHVFLATWIDVGYYNEKSDKVNTYQVAISSNGTHSYAELLYPENGIQWIQGESHPSGLPDAKAQAGFMSDGRMYTLKGSGTDQIQNIDKWSNVNRPGQWVFQIGPIPDGDDIEAPDNIDDTSTRNEVSSCRTGSTSCHSKATCVDYEVGFCCSCKEGYFGNGKSCQPNDVPLRVIGRIYGTINGIEFQSRDLQCYVQTKDGRTYTAVSRIPEQIGPHFQLLNNLGGVIGWLFAKPVSETKNGYQLTGGLFNHTSELTFTGTGSKVVIRSKYLGLDVFGQLRMEAEIVGSLPRMEKDTRVEFSDHDELYTRGEAGVIRSHTEKTCKLIEGSEQREYPFIHDQTITFNECHHAATSSKEATTRLKFFRGVTTYESTEGIIRFAVNTKIAPLEEEDPCIQGRETCGPHSSCVVDGDEFKCVCNPGYQYLYEEDGSAICVDVNECTAGNHACSPNAQCINQEGSHTCHCRSGFIGDGRICEKVGSCQDTRCDNYEQCVMVDGAPTCMCISGFEETDQGCYPVQNESCDVENNCSPNGMCSFDGNRQKYVCSCLPGFVGDGFTCYPDTEANATHVPPQPTCIIGMCYCPDGWNYANNTCVRQGPDSAVSTDNRNLLARPLPECLDDYCICPWGFDYDLPEEICIPRPGLNLDTMGPSGIHSSCNVVNTCHPEAQCVYVQEEETTYYACRCNVGYIGDGFDCVKTEISCEEVDICDPNASCRHEETTAKCICNPGFEGDGTICSPIDECSDNSSCKDNESCTYNVWKSRYECNCNSGFSMVDGHCIKSDCTMNPSQCHMNAQCVFHDGEYKCICISKYHGDGISQCIEDHIGCNVLYNCGRNAVCGYNQTSENYACICKPGYYGDGFTCRPQSSCRKDPSICSRDATCVSAGANQFACVCNEDFTGDGTTCRSKPKHDSNFLLVNQGMATLRIPFTPTYDMPGTPIYIAYTQMAIALDIDCQTGKAYSGDINGNRIVELSYNGSISRTFISGVTSPEGISVDWVSRNIFWIDVGKSTLEVANLDTKKRKVLVSEGLINPRGIAVHPYRGKVFWSDWNRSAPKLEWINEDGTGRGIFLQGNHVKLPNSLTIDWSTDELCWADAGTSTINCIHIDSRELRVVVRELSYPFGLAVSQNYYYWTDWKTHKIEVALRGSGERKEPISIPPGGSGKLYGIVVVPEACPRVTNVCQYENGRCNQDQLCLPDGQGGRTCLCADNASGPCIDTRYP